ncbi:signal peptide, CUB and EGF-like domain-containing protein 1 [Orbicella faveolata]|uniref:signal peptide, CUB and EGF-like domain-containing protein 1 n=1 Tax=Orbicella faveolata TaxID=48498 RepID=UPI0009E4AC89|nr:signal peptide, CUB and EGF-like domain-containing protein 1 [Orbicella faveolata]
MVCKCEAGYTGTHCDTNINDCTPGSCVRGKCIDGINSYRCECPKGFWGSRCEQAINDEKECEPMDEPVNGYKRCVSYSGKQGCTLGCKNGMAFSSSAVIEYECGPDTSWKWNGEVIKSLPKCLPSSSPREMRQRISLQFPLTQTCRTKEQFMEIETSFREAFLQAIRPVPEYECFESGLCSIADVKVSGCESFTGGRKKRAVGSDSITTIECTVIFRTSKRNGSAPNAAEKAGSVAFQLQYVVSMGQFTMNISENVLVARQGSLQHLSSEFTCGLGYFIDIGNSSCVGCPPGFFLDTSTKHCRECDIGSYQDTEGQVRCQSCPSGYTTKSKNSDSVDDCYRVKAVGDEEETSKKTMQIIIALSVVGVILIVAIFGVCYCVMSRQKKGKTDELTRRRSRVNNIYVDYPGSNQGFVSSNLKLENIGKPSPNVEMN